MKKKFPTIGHFAVIFLYYILFSLPFIPIQGIISEKYRAWFTLIVYIIPLYLTIWAIRRTFNKKGKLNYKPAHWHLLPLVIVTAYAFFVVAEMTVFLLPEPTGIWKDLFDELNKSIEKIFDNHIAGFLMVSVAAPILEETLFRGVLLRALLKKYNPYKAILLSAIAFGIFHMNPWQFLYATVLGLFLGYIYWKTRSLFYPILIHFILNSTAFFAAQIFDINETEGLTEHLTGNDLILFIILVITALIVIYFAWNFFEKYFAQVPKEIILATQNPHKIEEIKKILPEHYRIKSLYDLDFKDTLKETGNTLEDNALQKVRQISIPYDVDAIADDTGLEVMALNGVPGVYSARYAGDKATYEDNVQKLLEEMNDIKNREAQFRTVVAYSKDNKEHIVSGVVKGYITTEPRGNGGFGYDSVFVPEGYSQTFAEMSETEKNKISHRAVALQKLKEVLD